MLQLIALICIVGIIISGLPIQLIDIIVKGAALKHRNGI